MDASASKVITKIIYEILTKVIYDVNEMSQNLHLVQKIFWILSTK